MRMSGLLGNIDHFDLEVEDWTQYVKRLGQFFEANRIVGEENAAKRRSTFLSIVGPVPYKLLQSILAPVKPSKKTFNSEVMQCFRFNTRPHKPGESVATYMAKLRRLAEFCNFGPTLDKMIQDKTSQWNKRQRHTKEAAIRASANIYKSLGDHPRS